MSDSHPVVIHASGTLTNDGAERIRRQLTTILSPRCWVLVKGWHDQGGIEGVYGPYSEQHADWLLASLLDCSSCNWTKAKLASGPEAT